MTYKYNQVISATWFLILAIYEKNYTQILFEPYFPLHSEHCGRTVEIHRLFSHASLSP